MKLAFAFTHALRRRPYRSKIPARSFRYFCSQTNTQSTPSRKYPIGISDWKKIKERNYFFWDRTNFVKEFYEDPGETVLILRPRRWAKSTTLSMVKYFFDVNNRDLAKKLFTGTQLEESDKDFVNQFCGQFPVIALSFGKCRANNWEEMQKDLNAIISRVYYDHIYLTQKEGFLYEHEQIEFDRILKRDPSAHFKFALFNLTTILQRYHQKCVIVLIDEYDLPVNEAFLHGYHEMALPYLTSAFTGALKDNPCLEKGLLTGVLRVAKAGYLSGLNNLMVYSLLDREYADKYGVKQEELDEALKREGLSDKSRDVKSYYNGYSTAVPSLLLYNPWSILNYLKKKELQPYWIETGKTTIIDRALWNSEQKVRDNLHVLTLRHDENNPVEITVPFGKDVTFNQLTEARSIWSLLYFAGYITGCPDSEGNLKARVPNLEVKQELLGIWSRLFEAAHVYSHFQDTVTALVCGQAKQVEENLRLIAKTFFKFRNTTIKPEFWYHAFIYAIALPLEKQGYRVEPETESGNGFADIIIYPPKGKPGIVIEFKTKVKHETITDHEGLRAHAQSGIAQIEKNEYIISLQRTVPHIYVYSVAVHGKYVAVEFKEITPFQAQK